MLDYLTNAPEALEQRDIDNIWTGILMQVREWPRATLNDRKIIADTVFRVVRKLLCHHWDSYYSDYLYELFSITIDRESGDSDKKEQKRFQERLSEFSEQLDDWINNRYNGHLSEEVELVIKGNVAKTKVLKPRSGRKAKDPNSIVATFDYLPHLPDRAARLQAFFQSLKGKYIDIKTDPKDFIDLFQNTTTTNKIVWIGEIKSLRYLIDKLEKEELIVCPKGITKWQIVCAHIQIRVKHKNVVDNKTDDSFIIEDLKTMQFTKGGKKPNQIEDLDRIIRILQPSIRYNDALQDYLDFQQEHDEIKDKEDALANGLNTDVKV